MRFQYRQSANEEWLGMTEPQFFVGTNKGVNEVRVMAYVGGAKRGYHVELQLNEEDLISGLVKLRDFQKLGRLEHDLVKAKRKIRELEAQLGVVNA